MSPRRVTPPKATEPVEAAPADAAAPQPESPPVPPVAAGDPPAPQPSFAWTDAMTRYAILGATGVVLVLGVLARGIPGLTDSGGSIYVGSPEVYTRERLVNDRYDQDYWLHAQLTRLDETKGADLLTGRTSVSTSTNVQVKASPQAAAAMAADGGDNCGGGGGDEGGG
jgi:hypothetical protein